MAKPVTDITPRKRDDWRWRFLEMLAKSACVNTSCVHAGVSRTTAYRHYDDHPKFRKRWDEALVIATEALEAEARLRAFDRSDPASATMLIFLLKAHKPAKYRENHKPPEPPPADDPSKLSDDELIRRATEALRGADPKGLGPR